MRERHLLMGMLAAIVGCGRDDPTDHAAPLDTAAALAAATPLDSMARPPSWAVPPRFTNLTCAPSVLRRGDVLSMRMTRPHGSSFMAIGPDRTPYIVVFHGEGERDRGQRKSLVPPDSFAGVTELNIDPTSFTAGVWVFGRDTNELLFQRPGFYRLVVGNDLETDGPSYAECVVRYAP
jgi:hypothetical protein